MKLEGLTFPEAAAKYNVSEVTVRRWWQTKRIKGQKVCGVILLDKADLAKYYKNNAADILKFSRAYRRGERK